MKWRNILASLFLSLGLISPCRGQASETREFILACTYGTLAGTLVGAATLAFTDRPGDNLNKVARGASIGLYAGILLGIYLVYLLPGEGSSDEEELYQDAVSKMNWELAPIISNQGFEGASVQYRAFTF